MTFTALGQLWFLLGMCLDMCRDSSPFLMWYKAKSGFLSLSGIFKIFPLSSELLSCGHVYLCKCDVCVQYTDSFVTVPFGNG